MLANERLFSVSLETPGYLAREVREREAARAIDVAEEFIRLQGGERVRDDNEEVATGLRELAVLELNR